MRIIVSTRRKKACAEDSELQCIHNRMTLDEGSNSSNKSNSTDVFPEEFVISYGVIEFFLSLFCLFMVIYLSIRLKKRAWDSPAKRFGHFFNVTVVLSVLSSVVMSFNQYF